MRWMLRFGYLLLLAAGPVAAGEETPQTAPETGTRVDPQMLDAMKRMMALAEPGEEHRNFARAVGTWKTRSLVWGQGPGAEPTATTGECRFEQILGGRFVMQRCKGEFLPGVPFEGIGIEGYDNFRKQYTSLWMDTMSTAVSTMFGNCDAAGESCTYFGRVDDPASGQVGKMIKAELHWTGTDKMVFDMYDALPGGDWFKVMQITYARAD